MVFVGEEELLYIGRPPSSYQGFRAVAEIIATDSRI
jgi:hypothetical protein